MEMALGRPVDIAINHDPEAVAMHRINHPHTRHYCEDVWAVDPVAVCAARPVGLAWFSPDCKHFSKAKGGQPVSRKVRGLAWVVIKWAQKVRPRVIMLENVEEFQDWGPLAPACDRHGRIRIDADGKVVMLPCGINRGQTFFRWVGRLERLGYRVEWRELRACDYGAPTIRRRLFLVARRDGLPFPGRSRRTAIPRARRCCPADCCHGAPPPSVSTGRSRARPFLSVNGHWPKRLAAESPKG